MSEPALTEASELPEGVVIPLTSVALVRDPVSWDYVAGRESAIAAGWRERVAAQPSLFNGRFFVLTRFRVADGHMTGSLVETDYASYLHWRAEGFPTRGWNCFAMPALEPADGGILLGRMATWTANAGLWYCPAGSLDAGDLQADGRFDVEGNMRRELSEELGFAAEELSFAPTWTAVVTKGRFALMRACPVPETGAALIARCEAHFSTEERPELDGLMIARGAADIAGLRTPPFLEAYLKHRAK